MKSKDYLRLWAAAFVILLGSALLFTQPGYMDAYYYYHVAANLAQGRGLVEDFVWNYLSLPEGIPHPSNTYWMPLTSLVAFPFLGLFGVSFRASQIPFILTSSLVPLLASWLAWNLGRDRRQALAAGILTILGGFYFAYWTLPDSFGLYVITVTLALILMGKAAEGPLANPILPNWSILRPPSPSDDGLQPEKEPALYRPPAHPREIAAAQPTSQREARPVIPSLQPLSLARYFSVGLSSVVQRVHPFLLAGAGGVMVALSHLARADGALLVLVMALLFALTQPKKRALALFAVGFGVYLLVMSPWLFRNWSLMGSPLPPGSLKAVFLKGYDEFFSYGADLSWRSLLDWGLGPILLYKVLALGENLKVFMGGQLYLAPFAAVGLWAWRRERQLLPFFLYAALLYFSLSIIFTFPGVRGSMVHSGVALLPWMAVASVRGIHLATEWVGRRLPHWDVPKAQRNFTLLAVFFGVTMSLFYFRHEVATRDKEYLKYLELASWFQGNTPSSRPAGSGQAPGDALVMLTNPPAYFYASGRPSVVTPSDGLDSLIRAADAYGVTYLALEAAHARPLRELYLGRETSPRLERLATIGDTHIYRILPP